MRSIPVRLSARCAVVALIAAGAATAGAVQLGSASGAEAPNITRVDYVAPTDFSDDRRLAGFAENVFFGRVTGDGKTTDKDPLPETAFPVQVVNTLKGSAAGSVVVVQQGGQLPGRDDEAGAARGRPAAAARPDVPVRHAAPTPRAGASWWRDTATCACAARRTRASSALGSPRPSDLRSRSSKRRWQPAGSAGAALR